MIDLSSDTQTRPSAAMREAIARAVVGDEQHDDDPTVTTLNERVADLLGKPAALFLPTGTMCNLIAVKTHTRPADVIFAESDAHVLRAEAGGAALASGVLTESVRGAAGLPPGCFGPDDLDAAIARACALPAPHGPAPRLLCVEQTHNFGGGSVWPVELLAAVGARAREHGLAVHMDGARLLNAVRATGRPALDFCRSVDSVWLDFTKGLGAPLGAVLAGDREFIAAARRYKHLFGGAMRQAGIAAAACLYALDHHVERLDEDHANAQRLAAGLAAVRGLRLVHGAPQTNIVFFEVDKGSFDAAGFAARCLERGLRFSAIAGRVRAVTHLDVGRTGIEEAIRIVTDVLDAAGSRLAD